MLGMVRHVESSSFRSMKLAAELLTHRANSLRDEYLVALATALGKQRVEVSMDDEPPRGFLPPDVNREFNAMEEASSKLVAPVCGKCSYVTCSCFIYVHGRVWLGAHVHTLTHAPSCTGPGLGRRGRGTAIHIRTGTRN